MFKFFIRKFALYIIIPILFFCLGYGLCYNITKYNVYFEHQNELSGILYETSRAYLMLNADGGIEGLSNTKLEYIFKQSKTNQTLLDIYGLIWLCSPNEKITEEQEKILYSYFTKVNKAIEKYERGTYTNEDIEFLFTVGNNFNKCFSQKEQYNFLYDIIKQ